jgi:hypothetical protein
VRLLHLITIGRALILSSLRAAHIDIRAELLRFHAHHYSANGMKLVVLGTDLDALQATVERCFAPIRNTGRAPLRFGRGGTAGGRVGWRGNQCHQQQ